MDTQTDLAEPLHQALQPEGWARPSGYANGILARGSLVFTAGLVGWDANKRFQYTDFAGQFHQALDNVKTVLTEAGARPEHLVRLTCYLTDKQEYLNDLRAIGDIWRAVLGPVYPCMAVVEVSALIEDAAKIEIEATAVIPDPELAHRGVGS